MAATTPRRSARIPHQHTPKMSERKKGLFQGGSEAPRESLTRHRQLTVLESESESDDCDLGIMGALDSSSCDETDSNALKTPERSVWLGTRSHSQKLLKENQDLKNFIKSPFTLKKYQTRYSCPEKCSGSFSTPVTPHFHNHPKTPSSSHSCASVQTTSSTSSRARKSLASLIADTESCSSSLKDLTFESDSGADSKENTPTKLRRSSRKKLTPKLNSFKGILTEQKKNETPIKNPIVALTKMDITTLMSPTQMMKTPNSATESKASPPKLGPNRRSTILIDESPESCSSEKSQKRLVYDSKTDHGPNTKYPRLENNPAPKARLSLFNSDRLKDILSTKSFYGKSDPDLNNAIIRNKLSNAIQATQTHRRRLFTSSYSSKRKRQPGQINMGVRHKIRKPKIHKNKLVMYKGNTANNLNGTAVNSTASSAMLNASVNSQDTSVLTQDSSQELIDKGDPFDKEKQTIEALLSQWTEEEVPETELSHKPELPCFNKAIIEETNQIFQPITAIPVPAVDIAPQGTDSVIVELGAQKRSEVVTKDVENFSKVDVRVPGQQNVLGVQDVVMAEAGHRESHGEVPNEAFLPVEGGYILVEDAATAEPAQEVVPDLDELERELKMLDEQIQQLASSNTTADVTAPHTDVNSSTPAQKLFPIFSAPNPGTSAAPAAKGTPPSKRPLLKSVRDQYVIDAGQNKFGATQCTQCGVIYQIGDPQDEHDHLVHHNAFDVLKFNGLKEECIVGRAGSARCIRIRGGQPGWKKVLAVLDRVVHPQLGIGHPLPAARTQLYTVDTTYQMSETDIQRNHYKHGLAFLYVNGRDIVGLLVVEPRVQAHRLIPGEPDCCSRDTYPVKCGVSRLWTHTGWRRRGLASRLLDCARAAFLYGAAITTDQLAFSAPTPAGKAFATAYTGTENFYVYIE